MDGEAARPPFQQQGAIVEIRSRRESLAARLAVPNLGAADIRRLRELLRTM